MRWTKPVCQHRFVLHVSILVSTDITYESNLYDMTHKYITVFFKDIAGNLDTGNHGGKFGEHVTVDLTKVLESYLRTEHDLDLGMIHGYLTTDKPFNTQL